MRALFGRTASSYESLRAGTWVPMLLATLVALTLTGLHYYQRQRLQHATMILRELGRASTDLNKGFLHVTLADTPDSPWQRDQGIALITQALAEFDRAAQQLTIPFDAGRAFRSDMERFRTLLTHIARAPGGPSERDRVELRLALYHLDASAQRIDRLLLDDLSQLQANLERAFASAFAASLLLLGLVFFGIHRSRREALAALGLLETISASSTDTIFAKDRDGRYLLFNKELSRITGKSAQEALGDDDRALFPPEQAEQLMANDRMVIEQRQTRTYEEEVSTIDGPQTYLATKGPLVDRHGTVIGTFGISRNISRRKAMERSLEEHRTQLETIIQSLDQGLVISDPQGQLLRSNQAALTLYELRADQCSGGLEQFRNRYQVTTLDGAPVPFDVWPLNRVLRGEHLRSVELCVRRVGTDWSRVHSFGGTMIQGQDGKPLFALLTILDVTPRHQAEESLRRTQRMEALGTLAAGIAHDFNNILMAIAGNARLAQEDLPAGHPARESLHEIVRAGARATDLVRSILLFSRAQEPQRQTVRLESLIEEALALVRPTTPPMVEFSTRFAAAVPPVSMDPSQMHQVIVNLVTNSVYAITHGPRQHGTIRIELDTRRIEAQEMPGGQRLAPGTYVHLVVTDNGSGMEPAMLTKIFDPFFTTKPAGQGTGLGMSVVHGIVRSHDGAISIASQPGDGTSVEIYLPPAREPVATLPAQESTTPRAREKRVLYLDDEESLVFLAVRFLQKRGHSVTGFIDPDEALRAFRAQPDAYDVVVTDVSMPGMSGFDVAKAMLKVRPDIVIVMMSGYLRPEERENALAIGVKELMLKPSTIEELADAVDRQVG